MNSAKYLYSKNVLRFFTSMKYPVQLQISKENHKVKSVERPEDSKVVQKDDPIPKAKVDADTIALLERLSLVDCMNKEEVRTLEAALEFADQILQVDTANVEPLITVLEDFPLRVREDEVTEGNCKEAILKNALVVEEDYFVAPPGNIPLETRDNLLHDIDPKKQID